MHNKSDSAGIQNRKKEEGGILTANCYGLQPGLVI